MDKRKKKIQSILGAQNHAKIIVLWLGLFSILLALLPLEVRANQAQLKAEEIIEKSIQAQGGRESWEKIKDSVVTATCKIYLPQGEILMERKIYTKIDPYKIRIEQNILGQQIIISFDGQNTWIQQMGQTMVAPEPINQAMKASASRENLLLKYKQAGYKTEYLGQSQVEDKKCHQIKIYSPEVGETIYHFDLETFLPIKTEFEAPNESGQVVKNEIISSDFKRIEQILAPFKMVVFTQGRKAMEIMVQEIKFNQGLEDSLFLKPEKLTFPN